MARATPIWDNFNSGELDPRLNGRVDNDKYYSGLSVCENFVPIIQGPLTRRPGSQFIEALGSNVYSRNMRFSFSIDTNYVLEMGEGYIRFWRDRALLLSGGTPYQIASPFTMDDLRKLRYVQSADVLYITSDGRLPLQKLTRLGDVNWAIGDAPLTEGPLADQNANKARNMWFVDANTDPGAPGHVVTMSADFDVFSGASVGYFYELEIITRGAASAWTANLGVGTGDGFEVGDVVFYQERFYLAIDTSSDGHTGSTPPIHTEGTAWDGKDGVNWQYLHAGYGLVRITAVTDARNATATVIDRLPTFVKDEANKTYRWNRSAYGDDIGWPTAVTFFRERLTLLGNQRLDESVAQDFENFQRRDAGEVTDDLAVAVRIASGSVNQIRWASPGSAGLIIGTRGQEFLQDEASQNTPFGSTNSRIRPMSQYGSATDAPTELIGDSTIYVLRSTKRLMGAVYDYSVDRVVSTNLSKFAEHIVAPGVVDMAYQQNPYSVLWIVLATGALVAMTYDREQGVIAFHRHPMVNAFVDSVCVIPSPDGTTDDVWISVRRRVNGTTVRYQELLTFQDVTVDKAQGQFLDCGKWFHSDTKTTVIDGYDHLEGQTLSILADGAAQAPQVVTGGKITLEYAAKDVFAGYNEVSRFRTMRIEAGQPEGTAQGRRKRIYSVFLRVLNTLGGRIGMTFDDLDIIPTRAGMSTDMDQSPPASDDATEEVSMPGSYDRDGYVCFVQDQPFPTTIVAIVPKVMTTD